MINFHYEEVKPREGTEGTGGSINSLRFLSASSFLLTTVFQKFANAVQASEEPMMAPITKLYSRSRSRSKPRATNRFLLSTSHEGQ